MTHSVPTTGRPTHQPSAHGAADPSTPDAAHARRGVLAYLVAVIVLSGAVQAAIIRTQNLDIFPLLMWMPALASILVRVARRADPLSNQVARA